MKIKLLITLYGRPEITDLCFMGVKRIQKFNVDPICIYSDKENEKLVKKYGFEGYYHENKPLGRKLNFGIDKALESDWDYLMQIGSDDLVSDKLFEIYKPYIDAQDKAFGINKVFFYDMVTGKSAVGDNPYAFGCGRMIHRSCFEKKYQYKVRALKSFAGKRFSYGKGAEFNLTENIAKRFAESGLVKIISKVDISTALWDDNRNRSLDFDSHFKLSQMGINIKTVKSDEILCVDLKSKQNLWGFDFFDEVKDDVINYFPEKDAVRKVRQKYYNSDVHNVKG